MSTKVLVVDDDEEYRGIVVGALKTGGFETVEADCMAQGLEVYRKERPEAVVLDGQLPDGDGFALCAILRKEPGGEKLPVLLCTIRGSFEEVVAGLSAGPDDYVVKPFDDHELLARLRSAIDARKT
ncbi:MAG: response regulator [Elusimicrobia bacterium]|nr:response regulator [Elusimicrobiota bacterium]